MAEIWMTGGGGFDVSPVTAGTPDVIQGKVIVDRDGNALTGTLVDQSAYTQAISMVQSQNASGTQTIYTRIPQGAYRTPSVSGSPEITTPASLVAAAGGLTASKILAGQNAFGINGTATADANLPANRVVSGFSGYANGQKINGTVPVQGPETDGDRMWATNASNWAGTINVGIRNGHFLNGVNWVRYDMPNYRPEYIKKGVNMGGVIGTWEGFIAGPTDLYNRGNNAFGFENLIGKGVNNPVYETGGIRCPNSSVRLQFSGNKLNLTGYWRMRAEIRFDGKQTSSGKNFQMGARFGTYNGNSGSWDLEEAIGIQGYVPVYAGQTLTLDMPFAPAPRLLKNLRILIDNAYEWWSEEDQRYYWQNYTTWTGWTWRVWME